MNRTLLIRSAATALTLLGLSSAMAASASASGYDLYDRVARNNAHNNAMAAQMRPAAAPESVVPGPYARHLIYLGVDADQAIRQARAVGEQATAETVVPATQRRSGGFDLYDRIAIRHAGSAAFLR